MLSLRLDPVKFGGVPVARLTAALNPASSAEARSGLVAASAIYLGFVRQRFLNAARGDGTWRPLAASTVARRLGRSKNARRGKSMTRQQRASSLEILRDTGLLFNSLSTGGAGSIQRPVPFGIEVGTAIRYAKYHQFGGSTPGRPPQRAILVPPDDATRAQMRDVLQAAVLRAAAHA